VPFCLSPSVVDERILVNFFELMVPVGLKIQSPSAGMHHAKDQLGARAGPTAKRGLDGLRDAIGGAAERMKMWTGRKNVAYLGTESAGG
jgi:hypothetical protein